jgi:hypothetical protein
MLGAPGTGDRRSSSTPSKAFPVRRQCGASLLRYECAYATRLKSGRIPSPSPGEARLRGELRNHHTTSCGLPLFDVVEQAQFGFIVQNRVRAW